ncbi:Uncharacterised protein [Candidatus Bilamarchaeum dharawalense]|uniref:Uncharacterized protein n=1 Tax=Candidatus Bilamarchaeum dharawalense TaxID=2885759 RepID=A0A5E4LY79_9ARCH|nr:Uncharacterised protein [Candidatus Bilamarchaeum dharawalense]
MKPTVEYVTLPTTQAAKMFSPNVEFVGKELRSITLTLPLLNPSDSYLIIRLPHESLKEMTQYIKTLPKNQQISFVYDWLMRNQNVALEKYQKNKAKQFTYDIIPLKLSRIIPSISLNSGNELGTKESPYLPTVNFSGSVSGKGKTKVVLPLVVHVEGVESSFHFKIDLKLIQLSKENITETSTTISHLVKGQIIKWAEERHIDTGSRDFKSALHETISTIGPNIREQIKKLKSRHSEWASYLDSH